MAKRTRSSPIAKVVDWPSLTDRVCNGCGRELPVSAFSRVKASNAYGWRYRSRCHACDVASVMKRSARPCESCGEIVSTLSGPCWSCRYATSPTMHRQPWGGCNEWTGATNRWGYGNVDPKYGSGRVHVAVWMAYYGPIPDGFFVCHSCDNPRCFLIQHLWLGTVRDNNADRDAKGRQARGETSGGAKLTDDAVREIRRRYIDKNRYSNARELAEQFGVSSSTIVAVARHRTWKHVV